MTKEYLEPDGTFSPSTGLTHELGQFQRLTQQFPGLPDDEMAHRLATTKKQIRKMRKLMGDL